MNLSLVAILSTGVPSSLSLAIARSADLPRFSLCFAVSKSDELCQSDCSGAVFGGRSNRSLVFGLVLLELESLRIDFVRDSGLRNVLSRRLVLLASSCRFGDGCGKTSLA